MPVITKPPDTLGGYFVSVKRVVFGGDQAVKLDLDNRVLNCFLRFRVFRFESEKDLDSKFLFFSLKKQKQIHHLLPCQFSWVSPYGDKHVIHVYPSFIQQGSDLIWLHVTKKLVIGNVKMFRNP